MTIDEVGNVAAFLFSDLASAITGEITYVDGGFSTVAAASTKNRLTAPRRRAIDRRRARPTS